MVIYDYYQVYMLYKYNNVGEKLKEDMSVWPEVVVEGMLTDSSVYLLA